MVKVDPPAGLLQPYLWNWLLWFVSTFKYIFCSYVANWGLFWYNDGGEMMQKCLMVGAQGSVAKFVVADGS